MKHITAANKIKKSKMNLSKSIAPQTCSVALRRCNAHGRLQIGTSSSSRLQLVTRHTSHVTRHTSNVTRHSSLGFRHSAHLQHCNA
jgi:hypothetical protein